MSVETYDLLADVVFYLHWILILNSFALFVYFFIPAITLLKHKWLFIPLALNVAYYTGTVLSRFVFGGCILTKIEDILRLRRNSTFISGDLFVIKLVNDIFKVELTEAWIIGAILFFSVLTITSVIMVYRKLVPFLEEEYQ